MRRFWKLATRSRKRKVASAILALTLTSATTALAAFFLFQGVGGSGNGTFTTATISPAITVSSTANPVILGPNDVEPWAISVKNNDLNSQHTLTGLTATFASSGGTTCSNALAFILGSAAANSLPHPINPGATWNPLADPSTGSRVAATSAPDACAGATWTATFAGTETKP